jgi:hypothetical protein
MNLMKKALAAPDENHILSSTSVIKQAGTWHENPPVEMKGSLI